MDTATTTRPSTSAPQPSRRPPLPLPADDCEPPRRGPRGPPGPRRPPRRLRLRDLRDRQRGHGARDPASRRRSCWAPAPCRWASSTAAGTAPYVGFALVVGAWVDRLRRRRPLMIAADLVAAAALLTVPLAWALGLLTVPPAHRRRARGRRGPGDLPAGVQHPPARGGAAGGRDCGVLQAARLGGHRHHRRPHPRRLAGHPAHRAGRRAGGRAVVPALRTAGRQGPHAGAGRLRAAAAAPAGARDRRGDVLPGPRPPAARHRRRGGERQLLRADGLRAAGRLPDPRPRLHAADGRGGHRRRWCSAHLPVPSSRRGSPSGSAAAGRSSWGRRSSRSA